MIVAVNNALDGDGPFSPERSGGLPIGDFAKLCFSGKYTHNEIKKMIKGQGGMVAYLGTNDGRDAAKMIAEGDEQAKLVFHAMAYQVAKEIGMCATVLKGDIDAIILTGGLAHGEMLVGWIRESIDFLGKVIVYPGEDEMSALAQGGLRVLRGDEAAQIYE